MKKLAAFLLMLGLVSFVAVPAMAQETGTGTTTGTYTEQDDDGPDMGWLGLLGLAGLLGLKKRNPEPYRDTATRTTTATR
jgi:MYXO-CTERM domain-containing protein